MKDFFETIINAIIEAENTYINIPQSGKQKKEIVIETINKIIDIPVIPEFLEEQAFSLIIDLIVFIFNKYNFFNK
ncbi:MAG TPA: hypothetical protein P5556_03015 [Candidatus Gastranaerophilales bacterium]|nr:hypothetical protein [Candidatus Gastranaerophilales bacterium]